MDKNPVLKPKLVTPTLILSSLAILMCSVFLAAIATSTESPPMFLLLTVAAFLLAAAVAAVWFARSRKRQEWTAAANEKWIHLERVKQTSGTTTEVTVLSVDALEPTGSWITIKWNRFNHVQRAWLEALHDPIWPGSVLLISPDPTQVRPGAPWPPTYYIQASRCLAWAPSRGSPNVQSDRGHLPTEQVASESQP